MNNNLEDTIVINTDEINNALEDTMIINTEEINNALSEENDERNN